MKRIAFIAILLVLAAGMVLASGKQETGAAAKPVTITLMTMESDTQWNFKDTPNFKALQQVFLKKFNVDYQLETALSREFETTVTTRFASGGKLPDIINFRYADSKLVDLYKNGLIIKLNELVNTHGPDVKQLFTIRPFVLVANADRDGNILRIPAQYIENIQHRITVMHIRNDWLKKVGMNSVKTPEDYYNALKAFQDKDVNGSGKPDEILTTIGAANLNRTLGSAFGVPNMVGARDSWYADANGKVYHTFLTPEAKAYVTFANKLYAEKLLDQSFMNQTGEQINEKFYNNKVASMPGAWWDSVVRSQQVHDKGFEVSYIGLVPPITLAGKKPIVLLRDLPGYSGYMITKSCADPAAAMKTINWGYSLEGSIQNYYGESTPEGGDYYKKAAPVAGLSFPAYQMEYTEKGKAAQAAEPLLWAKMGWNMEFTTKVLIGNADAIALEFFRSFTPERCGLAAEIDFNLTNLKLAEFTYNIPATNFVSPTAPQVPQWDGLSDLWVYMDEQIAKFITGVRPLSEWDAFVTQCGTMGIKTATDIRQEQLDRKSVV